MTLVRGISVIICKINKYDANNTQLFLVEHVSNQQKSLRRLIRQIQTLIIACIGGLIIVNYTEIVEKYRLIQLVIYQFHFC